MFRFLVLQLVVRNELSERITDLVQSAAGVPCFSPAAFGR